MPQQALLHKSLLELQKRYSQSTVKVHHDNTHCIHTLLKELEQQVQPIFPSCVNIITDMTTKRHGNISCSQQQYHHHSSNEGESTTTNKDRHENRYWEFPQEIVNTQRRMIEDNKNIFTETRDVTLV